MTPPVESVPEPVERMMAATNAGDSDAFVACFTDDAFLSDWGREFRGHEGVRSWDATDNIGKHAHFEATGSKREGAEDVVTIVVTGGGFNGTGDTRFTIVDDLISRMIISPE
jgi:hypothetical protein